MAQLFLEKFECNLPNTGVTISSINLIFQLSLHHG